MDEWEKRARGVLRAEMVARGISYKRLVQLLAADGVEEKVLMNKVSRGKFSFSFFLQCMAAMGVTQVNLPKDWPKSAAPRPQGKTSLFG